MIIGLILDDYTNLTALLGLANGRGRPSLAETCHKYIVLILWEIARKNVIVTKTSTAIMQDDKEESCHDKLDRIVAQLYVHPRFQHPQVPTNFSIIA